MPSRIVLSMCFVFLLMLFVNTPLGHAESTGPSDRAEVADPTSSHPCTARENYQRYVDHLIEQRDRLEEEKWTALDAYVESRNALDEVMNYAAYFWCDRVGLSILDHSIRPGDEVHPLDDPTAPPYPHPYHYEWMVSELLERIEYGEERYPSSTRTKCYIDLLSRLISTYATYTENKNAYFSLMDQYDQASDQVISVQTTLRDLETACNQTRVQSRPWTEILAEMDDPMGSYAPKPRNQGDPVFPFVVPNDASQQTMSGETAKPETDVTAQTMQVQEPEVDQRVWTHRPVPLNTSPSRVAVPSAQPQNTTPPKSLIGVPLLPRTK